MSVLLTTAYVRQTHRYERLIDACNKRFKQFIDLVRRSTIMRAGTSDLQSHRTGSLLITPNRTFSDPTSFMDEVKPAAPFPF